MFDNIFIMKDKKKNGGIFPGTIFCSLHFIDLVGNTTSCRPDFNKHGREAISKGKLIEIFFQIKKKDINPQNQDIK